MTYRVSHEPKLFFRLRGDQQAARALIRQGRIYFAQLIDAMSEREWSYMFKDWRLPTGETFLVHAWRDHRGEWGTVEITAGAPGIKEPLFLPAPESGFLNIEDLSTADPHDLRAFPALHQSGRTRVLYTLIQKPVPLQDVPPSHWYDEATVTPSEAATLRARLDAKISVAGDTMLATGKYRLYQQAKRGFALTDGIPSTEAINNTVDLTTGLWRDSEYRYWKVDIRARRAEPDVLFTRMALPESVTANKWMQALKSAETLGNTDAVLILETWILGNLVKTTETYTSRIYLSPSEFWEYPGYAEWADWSDPNYSYPLARPIAHGWKFSQSGAKAACVILQQTAMATYYNNEWLNHADLTSHVVELAFSNRVDSGELVFDVQAETLEKADWRFENAWNYWIWTASIANSSPWLLDGYMLLGTVSNPEPENTPVYGWYNNETFESARITRKAAARNNSYYSCGESQGSAFAWTGAGLEPLTNHTDEGDVVFEQITMFSTTLSAVTNPVVSDYYASSVPSGAWTAWENYEAGSFVLCNTAGFCQTPNIETLPTYNNIIQQATWKGDGDAVVHLDRQYEIGTARLVIPENNAEAVLISVHEGSMSTEEITTNTYSSTYLDGANFAYKNDVCPNPAALTGTYPVASSVTQSASNRITGAITVIGKAGATLSVPYQASATGTDAASVYLASPALLLGSLQSIYDMDWPLGFRVAQGVGNEIQMTSSCTVAMAEPAWENTGAVAHGYPADLAHDKKTSVIGFA